MASVYSAYDTHLERIVAIKMLRAELEIEDVRVRMLREAQAMARLVGPASSRRDAMSRSRSERSDANSESRA